MRQRNAARLLVINQSNEVLLFRFQHRGDALDGRDYWATPGGGVEQGESFEEAAVRELLEETGLKVDEVGACVAERNFTMMLPSGETVRSVERYYLIRSQDRQLTRDGWTVDEARVMTEHKWWSVDELQQTRETVWPERLIEMITTA